jgi:hypothetical protein
MALRITKVGNSAGLLDYTLKAQLDLHRLDEATRGGALVSNRAQ